MKILILGTFLIATMVALVGTNPVSVPGAEREQVCLAREAALDQLENQHAEQVRGRGLTENGQGMVEVFAGKDGAGALVVTDVDGLSCVVSTGKAWRKVSPLFGFAA